MRVEKDGYEPFQRRVTITAGRMATVHALLSPVQPRSAHLWVDTEPADARVRILNIVPAFHQGLELAPGPYHIEVSSDGYVMKNEWIELAAGEDRIMAVRLEPVRRVVAPAPAPAPTPREVTPAPQPEAPQPKKQAKYTKLGQGGTELLSFWVAVPPLPKPQSECWLQPVS